MVGERSLGVEASSEEQGWSAGKRVCRNEYTIIRVRIPDTESPRVPEPGSSAPGQSVPKPRPKGVGDGKQVNIPVPVCKRLTLRGDAGVKGLSGGGISDVRW